MNETRCRPFYAEYAWAFDLLIDRPVEKECAVIAAWLVGRGILPGAEILDAGCGTARSSRELARRGFGNIEYFGAYDRSVELGATDRVVAVAQFSDDADKT